MDRFPYLKELATQDADASIFCTCHLVYSECVTILYGNKLFVPYELALAFERTFLRQIGSQNAARINNLTIGIISTDAERTPGDPRIMIKTLPSSLGGLLKIMIPHNSLTRLTLAYLPLEGDNSINLDWSNRLAANVEHESRMIQSMFLQLPITATVWLPT